MAKNMLAPARDFLATVRQNSREPSSLAPGRGCLTVPKIICILSLEDGETIGTEMLRYGLRVAVLGLPSPKELKTKKALEVVGPKAFGYPEVTFQAMPGHLL